MISPVWMSELTVTVLLAASVAHAAFQLTVTVLVYPSLIATAPGDWDRTHDRHTRRITPLVGLIYVPLALACGLAAWQLLSTLLADPASLVDGAGAALLAAGVVVALTGAAGAAAATAFGAAPVHGRLGAGHDEALLARLLTYDRWRCGAAVLGAGGAGLAAAAGSAIG